MLSVLVKIMQHLRLPLVLDDTKIRAEPVESRKEIKSLEEVQS